jgi:hypothetical protein
MKTGYLDACGHDGSAFAARGETTGEERVSRAGDADQ